MWHNVIFIHMCAKPWGWGGGCHTELLVLSHHLSVLYFTAVCTFHCVPHITNFWFEEPFKLVIKSENDTLQCLGWITCWTMSWLEAVTSLMIHGLPGNITVIVCIRFVCRLNEPNITWSLLSKGSGGLVFFALESRWTSCKPPFCCWR